MANTLVATDLSKEYPTPGAPLVVLKGVSFDLAVGKSMAIVGPSGSGKSTLLNILGTLDRPSSGMLRLADADPFSLGANALAAFRSRHVGFVFQDHHLLPQCTAVENVLVARLAAGPVRSQDSARAAELLGRVGLAERMSHLPSELSGGERQRVAIARALLNRPTLLLADEPTGNLDSVAAQTVGKLLRELAAADGAMLIVVTHSASLSDTFDSRLRMSDGLLTAE